jgi:arginyl-tRNA synthetase
VLEKAKDITAAGGEITAEPERALAKLLALYPEKVSAALSDYEPSVITRYIYEVASAFNRFYHECPIITAETDAQKAFRIRLTKAANNVLGSAFSLICMSKPEKV